MNTFCPSSHPKNVPQCDLGCWSLDSSNINRYPDIFRGDQLPLQTARINKVVKYHNQNIIRHFDVSTTNKYLTDNAIPKVLYPLLNTQRCLHHSANLPPEQLLTQQQLHSWKLNKITTVCPSVIIKKGENNLVSEVLILDGTKKLSKRTEYFHCHSLLTVCSL